MTRVSCSSVFACSSEQDAAIRRTKGNGPGGHPGERVKAEALQEGRAPALVLTLAASMQLFARIPVMRQQIAHELRATRSTFVDASSPPRADDVRREQRPDLHHTAALAHAEAVAPDRDGLPAGAPRIAGRFCKIISVDAFFAGARQPSLKEVPDHPAGPEDERR